MLKIKERVGGIDKIFPITEIFVKLKGIGPITISAMYYGYEKVWSLIRSCFGSGTWVKESSWSNSENWKNNN